MNEDILNTAEDAGQEDMPTVYDAFAQLGDGESGAESTADSDADGGDTPPPEGKVVLVDIDKEMRKSFLDYSMSVIVDRALPDVRDGLKPVHRRILYTAYEGGLFPERPYKKSAKIVGDVLASYHPHGDASVYDAMVRMAQSFSLRYPLIDGHGNFGSVDGDPPAAYRYTEAKMSRISTMMLADIDKNTVDWKGNYDDSKKEPVVLTSRFPNLLANGSVGIAVGMATNIPPHNLGELCDAIDLMIENPDCTLDELMQCVKGPDFPTGGIIMGRAGIREAYATGRGKIPLRSRCHIEEREGGRERIVVTEIPYMVNKAKLIERIAELVKQKRIEGIADLRDESDRDGMRIVIELKRDARSALILNQLYSYCELQVTVGVIMLVLDDNAPKVLSLKEMLTSYLEFQFEVVTRRIQYELAKDTARQHILNGLQMVVDNTDEVIRIIRFESKDKNDAKLNLMRRFGIDDAQAVAVVQMQLGQLAGMERIRLENELAEIAARIAEYNEILASSDRIYEIIRTELGAIRRRFADDRRTEIESISGEVDVESLIPVTTCVITYTHLGNIKRQPVDVYKAQRRGGRGISGMSHRDEDFVEEMFVCSSHDYIMFFTSRGKAYRIKAYEIGESSRGSKGSHIVNILNLEKDEKITAMLRVDNADDDSYFVMLTKLGIGESSRGSKGSHIVNILNLEKDEKITAMLRVDNADDDSYFVMLTKLGVIKRTPVSQYRNVRKNGLIAISLAEGDELSFVRNTSGSDELMIGTAGGVCIRFLETDVRSMGRTAGGVRAIRLSDGDCVVGLV